MSQKCPICLLGGHEEQQSRYYSNIIYLSGQRTQPLTLCYSHDIELFKLGQKQFALKYKDLVKKPVKSIDSGVLDYLKKYA